ncbi:glycosyl transferase [Streptomyces lucensis JCM 4490]|uniref:Glycosyl transferase n=1 Tax=Streptomyces lucensis JCM 4490 TaxID=1306176 RepID=A0A918MT12_9ACTN|nr:nucleotide disphospho-sugar-binding domain-containing protein [Streptomyces lucensis]GGW54712.1 glycosyl transferase [Streptomyces lucensis JCM 4490]
MRVLFTPYPWASHYYQMVGLVWAFRAAGHEVRVAVPPSVVDAVTGSGIVAVTVGGRYDLMAGVAGLVKARQELVDQPAGRDERGELRPEARRELLRLRMVPHTRAAQDAAEDLVAVTRAWRPDIVVADPLVYAAPLAAAAAGAPLVRHLWGPDMCRHLVMPGSGVSARDDPRAAWPAELAALYEKHGATPAADVAVRTLDNCPPGLQLPGVPNRIPMRFTAYNGTAVAPSWLSEPAGRPRICVTWGSAATAYLGPESFLVPRILDGLSGLDVDVVVAVRRADAARIPAVPAGVRIVEGMPLELILPGCDAIVHQSGAGTTLTAALHGVPQLTLPQVADQGLVSDRLARTGAGIVLAPDDTEPHAVEAAAGKLLGAGEHRAAALRLREEMLTQPAPSAVVRTLEDLVATHREG